MISSVTPGLQLATAQPWARSFRSKGKPSAPALSDQVQFNAMIPKDQLHQALKASGHNCIYLVPRDDQGQISQGWSIIWLTGCKADLARTALSVSEQVGLVRSKDRFGLRVTNDDYESVFKRLRPDQAPRSRVAVQFLYPLPIGTTEQSLVQWATGQSWPLRVMKGLGPTQWLVGAEKPRPPGWLAFRGEAVLITAVQKRTNERQVIQAGHRNLPQSGLARPDSAH